MSWIRRKWPAEDADEWTREDYIAMMLSPLAYILLTIGVTLSILLLVPGFFILAGAILITILLHWVIDPKLKAISTEFEKKQKHYIEDLEKIERWEH
jgi:hypothetical protein